MKKLTVCAVCALATCACTPGQVADVASALGVDIGPETATLVAFPRRAIFDGLQCRCGAGLAPTTAVVGEANRVA